MPYARIDDRLYDNPKAEQTSANALGHLTLALSYAGRHMTDGSIPPHFVARHLRPRRGSKRALAELAERRWLHAAGDLCDRCLTALRTAGTLPPTDGYYIHDYLEHNDSRAQIEQRRAGNRRRQGKRRAEERQAVIPWDADPDVSRRESRPPAVLDGTGGSTATTEPEAIDARALEVVSILSTAPRFAVAAPESVAGISAAIRAHGSADPISAAHAAVAKAHDPDFKLRSPVRVFTLALGEQEMGAGAPRGRRQSPSDLLRALNGDVV